MSQQSDKRVAITKANAQVVAVVGIAAFISVFCLVASHALWSQNAYLSKVSGLKKKADVQLQTNLKASKSLASSYASFTSSSINALGGSSTGNTNKDGDNAKLVLDALPSSYDFPALTSSIEKILSDQNLTVGSISGTDDEIAQQTAAASPSPQPVPMTFSFSAGNIKYQKVEDLVKALQQSIRPIQVDILSLTGGADNMQVSITAHTFFQPSKTINITTAAVK